jgi:hypothetical protein
MGRVGESGWFRESEALGAPTQGTWFFAHQDIFFRFGHHFRQTTWTMYKDLYGDWKRGSVGK